MAVRPYRTKAGETRWEYVVELPRGRDGRRRQEHRRGYPDKAAAETAELEARLRARAAARPDPGRMTVADLLDEWLAAVEPTVKPPTRANYRLYAAILADPLGPVPLRDLAGVQVQRAFNAYAARHSATFVSQLHTALRAALALAVDWDLIPRNPARHVARPPRRRRADPEPWTPAQAAAFLAAADAAPDRALWRLLLDTGCRIGEALALAWADVDLDAATVRVRRTLTTDERRRYLIGETAKTPHGNRLLALAPATVTALRWQRADQLRRKLACRPVWQEHGLVTDRGDGRWLNPATVDHRLMRLCEAAGVPRLSPHGLRHTVITLAVLAGVPLPVVQRRVGHASISVTADVYVAVDLPADRAAAAAVAALLPPARTARTEPDGADETPENSPPVTTDVTTDPQKRAI